VSPFPSADSFPSSGTLQGAGYRTFLEVQNAALGSDFDASRYREDVKRWINEALGKIAHRVTLIQPLQGTATITTATGVSTYELPADDIRVHSLGDSETATALDDVGVDAIDQSDTSQGRPAAFALYGGELLLYPTPDGVYSLELRFEREAWLLQDDGDTLPLPDAYADLPVNYARARLFEREDDFEAAQAWQARFESELLELRSDLGRQDRTRRRQIGGMWQVPAVAPRFQRP
jgi:hypothetical protein